MLQKILSQKINIWQEEVQMILADKGEKVISEVTVSQVYGGMRGIKGLTCETSAVSADKGLIIRGYPLSTVSHISPEEVFYLLLTGELPDPDAIVDIQDQFKLNQHVPDYIWRILEAMPKKSHPMTMLSTAIQSMQVDSIFVEKYNSGVPKTDLWKWTLEDGIKLLSVLPEIAAGIYRMRFNKGDRIKSERTLDWSGNFAHMLGFQDENFKKLMRLYLMLHCDHEGGNVSAFSSLTVASALSSPYLSVAAGLNGLAGPLHGLANHECLKFVLEVQEHFKGAPSKEDLKQFCWDRLDGGRVIPGYGHAVLRCSDPRFTAFIDFGEKYIKNDEVFSIVQSLFEVVPSVLKKQGKAKNPWPNVDAASGSLLYHYGLKEFNYYTVLFSISRAMGIIAQMVINRGMGIPITRPKSVTTEWIKNNI